MCLSSKRGFDGDITISFPEVISTVPTALGDHRHGLMLEQEVLHVIYVQKMSCL